MALEEEKTTESSERTVDYGACWLEAREKMRLDMGDPVFDAWIRPLSFVGAEGNEVKLSALTPFARNWVDGHHKQRIERALSKESGEAVTVAIAVVPAQKPAAPVQTAPAAAPAAPVENGTEGRKGLSHKVQQPTQTFETFVSGPANEFALRAAHDLATEDRNGIPMLYIHGGFGYGKSHLLNAIALEAQKRGRKPLFLGAEDFMRQFLGALNRKETLSFKEDLRAADVLLIDDLQHLCRSTYTVAEFLHTLNAFSDLRRKLVVAADKPPTAIENLSADLRARLSGGLVIGLDTPDRATRLGILKRCAAEFARTHDFEVPVGVLEHIADSERGAYDSPRDLVGAFNKVAMYADLTKQPLTVASACAILGQAAAAKKVSIEDIQRKTAEFYKLELRDFQSPMRARKVARPRQVAMYLARELTMRSLPEIGKRFGGRDHTTVLHACRRVVALCDDDAMFKQEVDFLRGVLSKGTLPLAA
ncbi:MAG TPA: chromosomal replication initiator protein DnaA [Candidatus Paceibacterota bacterium]